MKILLAIGRVALRTAGFALLLINPCFAVGGTIDLEDFEKEVDRYARSYDDLARRSDVQQLLISGNVDEYHRRLIQRVPDGEKSFYDYFVLANVLFREDREQSYRYMLRAEELQPLNPYVQYERGIHEHRRGNCDDAIVYYRQLQSNHADLAKPESWAYRAHCALVVGEYDEAVSAWGSANFSSRHTAIEKGMYEIFSTMRPHTIRQGILTRIRDGRHAAFCDLLDHDRNWEVDWWNVIAQERHLAYDLELAEQTIAAGSKQASVIRLCSEAANLSDAEFEAALIEAGLWGESAALPDSGSLTYAMARRLTASGAAEPKDILERLGAQMWERFEDGGADQKLLEVMGFLYSSVGDAARLREVDAYGWRELKLNRFAASYLLGMDPTAESYPALLDNAVADFPNDAFINRQKLASTDEARIRLIANYVAAEFANVGENWKGPYRLGDFMMSFEHELN